MELGKDGRVTYRELFLRMSSCIGPEKVYIDYWQAGAFAMWASDSNVNQNEVMYQRRYADIADIRAQADKPKCRV